MPAGRRRGPPFPAPASTGGWIAAARPSSSVPEPAHPAPPARSPPRRAVPRVPVDDSRGTCALLVVTANWAVADGSLVSRPRRGQVEWLAAVRRAAIRAGVGADGRYAPLGRLDVVLAGDTFDALTTDAWVGRVRPWHEGRRSAEVAGRVLIAAAARGRRLLGGLARWARAGIVVPAADGRGRPDWTRPHPVPVRVAVLPGDRDRWIASALPRLARRGVRVAAAWSADGIAVCHGAELDPAWSGSGGGPEPGRPTLGESLAVDLVARFGVAVRGDASWPEIRGLVAGLASAPPLDMPAVVADWLAAASPPAAQVVRDRWPAAVADWRRAARIAEPVCAAACDPLDAVAAWLEGAGAPGTADEIAPLFTDAVPSATHGAVVLGHLPTARSGGAVVCLGGRRDAAVEVETRGGAAVACVAPPHSAAGPLHVVFPRPGTSAAWAWLDGAAVAGGAVAARPAAATARIVEAA